MAAIGGNIQTLRRKVKDVAYNYSEAQIKVREATSNDPWGPSSSLMSEIADLTYNAMAFTEIMQMVWKRLNDHGKNWRHVYKSLVLLDYLIKVGSEKVSSQCRENIYSIQTLKDFQHIEDNKDQGMNVREKAKQLVAILKDDERLKNERTRALMAKKRFIQNGMGIGSDGSTSHVRRSETYHGDDGDQNIESDLGAGRVRRAGGTMRRGVSVPALNSEFEECRPSSIGEEELQLQIALALSKEEADKDQEAKKHDDVRLQLAIHESKAELERRNTLSGGESQSLMMVAAAASPRKNTSALDDLLSLQPVIGATASAVAHHASDPWLTPRSAGDPWNAHAPQSQAIDPWGAPIDAAQAAGPASDPWGGNASAHQPWSPNQPGVAGGSVTADPFAMSANGGHSFAAPLNDSVGSHGDPWGGDNTLMYQTENQQNNGTDAALANGEGNMGRSRQLKTPESFLGENSSLVNLDNLMMSSSKSAVPGLPPKTTSAFASNPFSTGGGPVNPFTAQQQQRATPTLNEMRNANQAPPTWVPPANQSNAAWGMSVPLEPQNTALTNPFI